ncbi:MAG TPA: multidrug ABC transporter permease [Alphaproteobacteria bacterium]|jgi:ABC-2 type transport system permease protein|nr:MAG: Inner membrane transport permease YadH [Alphaproteobacteria bacterium MarineAlpha9_Bin5]HIC70578.1 multidrug ABC transporter permease [Alphaproteobacteria bacterium]HIM72098.1 multidrug ABC transporter permease [Alphaproteobacteria bacterium]
MSETENFLAQGFNERKSQRDTVAETKVVPMLTTRRIGPINWIGLRTLYVKEVRRFLKVYSQTILAPAVTTLIFMTIFALALGGAVRTIGDVPFMIFLAPGLVMMAIVQNSFANTSSTIMIGKVQGCIVDVLMPPLSPSELTLAFAMGGVSRGVLVAIVTATAMSVYVPLAIYDYAALIFYALAASMMLSLMGLIAGIWAEKFDSMAAVTNFMITPLAFLSGTFYSVERLPEPWFTVSQINPFFYMIDGFRYAFIGRSDGSLLIGILILTISNALLWFTVRRMFVNGYKLKE